MAQAKAAKPTKSQISPSSSGRAVATALIKHFPKQAEEIVKVIMEAATSRSLKRKLLRVQLSLETLRKGAE
jgi:hypothetical protein